MLLPRDLRRRLHDEPFRPFRIHLSDGTSLEVPEPGMVIIGRTTAILPSEWGRDEQGFRVAENWRTISLLHIVQFSDLQEKLNGKRRQKK